MSDEAGETKPKVEGGDAGVISIKVKDQSGGEVVFRVKRTTKFSKIRDAFCQKKAWDSGQVRFIFDGQRVNADDTPESLELEDHDVSATSRETGNYPLPALCVSLPCRRCCAPGEAIDTLGHLFPTCRPSPPLLSLADH